MLAGDPDCAWCAIIGPSNVLPAAVKGFGRVALRSNAFSQLPLVCFSGSSTEPFQCRGP